MEDELVQGEKGGEASNEEEGGGREEGGGGSEGGSGGKGGGRNHIASFEIVNYMLTKQDLGSPQYEEAEEHGVEVRIGQ